MHKSKIILLIILFSIPQIMYIQGQSNTGRIILIDDDAIDDPVNLTWNTITEGLNHAEQGDTIKIYNGTYTEQLIIDVKNINIEGENTDLFGNDTGGVIIDGSGNKNTIKIVAHGVNIKGLTIQHSTVGIQIESHSISIKDSSIINCDSGIICCNASSISIKDNNINYSKTGVTLSKCNDVIISNNHILGENSIKGISCEESTDVYIDNNYITTTEGIGIEFYHLSQQNEIKDNTIENNTIGIKLWWSANNNKIIGNRISNSLSNAIHIDLSTSYQPSKLEILNNYIINNSGYGICLIHAREATINNNYIIGSKEDGIYCEISNYTKFTNNIINGNDDGFFQINCIGNTLQNNTIKYNDDGIYLSSSENTKVIGNTIRNNTNAITIEESRNTRLQENNISINQDGILLSTQANTNTIIENYIYNNTRYGIHLTFAKENIITENNIQNNGDAGVYIEINSQDNNIYYNNFLNNNRNAYDECTNKWDDGEGGNYWSDYTGIDNNGDGIGDTPYNIPGGSNKDNHPFISIDGWELLPDLSCEGDLSWSNVKPGSIVQGSFIIQNIGKSNSKLDWNITDWPTWGNNWNFTPSNGSDLTPEDGAITIKVTFIAPQQPKTSFSGYITIKNIHNPDDTCTIPVSLTTSKNNLFIYRIIEKLYGTFPILREIILQDFCTF